MHFPTGCPTRQGCKHPGCVPVYDTPKCVKQCSADDAGEVWSQAKYYAKQAFSIQENQYEIMCVSRRRNIPLCCSCHQPEQRSSAALEIGTLPHVAHSARPSAPRLNLRRHELMRDGPVTASFTVYTDFTTYKSGIYQHYEGEAHGIHAVKIMGWGTEGGVDFWLIANSWRRAWQHQGIISHACKL